jgi:hypothetical protein
MLTVWIPDGQAGTFEHNVVTPTGAVKNVHQARAHGQHRVVEIPQQLFQSLLGGPNGQLWEKLNPKAIEWMARMQGTNTYMGEQFPDENSPPPIAAVAAYAAPVSVKLRAPAGVGSYSVRGIESKVGKDGLIEVDGHVADELRPHGFVPV